MKTNLNRRAALTTGVLALLGLGYGGGFVLAESAAPRPKVVRLTARRFAYSPGQLTLKKGVPVVLELKSLDVLMGFNLPDFGLRADMLPDQAARVPFVPDKTGKFVFLCDIFCGTGHEQMQGTLTVVD